MLRTSSRATALITVTFFAMAVSPNLTRATETGVKQVHKTLALDPTGFLTVETYKGAVSVHTWDKPEVDIQARVEPDGDSAGQKQAVEQTEVRIEGSGAEVHVKSDYSKLEERSWPSSWFDWESRVLPFVRYEIHMPRTARLKIKDYKSDIRVDGLRAALDVDTYKGTSVISSLEGPLALHTYKGEARVAFTDVAGPSHVDTYKGDVEIALPHGKGVNLESELGRHGTLDVDPAVTVGFRSSPSHHEHYRGAVNGGGPELRLKTFKGTFHLRS